MRPIFINIIIATAAIIAGFYAFSLYTSVDRETVTTTGISASEAEQLYGEESALTGVVYFTAEDPDDNNNPYTYLYNIDADFIEKLGTVPYHTGAHVVNENELAMVAFDEGRFDAGDMANVLRPAIVNVASNTATYYEPTSTWGEQDLSVAPTSTLMVAWSEQTEKDLPVEQLIQPESWQIRVVQADETEALVIENALRPAFVNEGRELLYMRSDGIYKRDMESGAEVHVARVYTNLTLYDDFTANEEGEYIVMTLPSFNMVSIQEWLPEVEEFGEFLTISDEKAEYFTPVFNQEGDLYAVVEDRDGEQTIQVRHFLSRDIIRSVVPGQDIAGEVSLDDWYQ